MGKLSLPLYEPPEIEIAGAVYKLRPANRELFRKVSETEKRYAELEKTEGVAAGVELAYELVRLYVDAPGEVIDALPVEQVQAVAKFVTETITGKVRPAAPEDQEKNAPKPGDGTAV